MTAATRLATYGWNSDSDGSYDFYVPAGTQIVTVHGYRSGAEETLSYRRIDGVAMDLGAQCSCAGYTYDGKMSAGCFYMVEPPKEQTVTFTWGSVYPQGWNFVAFCITGINPVDPISSADCDCFSYAHGGGISLDASGAPVACLAVGQFAYGSGAVNTTTDPYSDAGVGNAGVYASMPADGTLQLSTYKNDTGVWGSSAGTLIALNLPPAIRRAGIILD